VEVEYVSAPREYEELLGTSDGAAAMDTDGPLGDDGPAPRGGLGAGAGAGGGLGFVAAGAAAGDGGVGGAGGGAGLGLGFTPGLGAGGATPGLGLGSDWGGETPGGAGLGLGATPRLGADADAGAPSASAVRPLVGPIAREGRRVSHNLLEPARSASRVVLWHSTACAAWVGSAWVCRCSGACWSDAAQTAGVLAQHSQSCPAAPRAA